MLHYICLMHWFLIIKFLINNLYKVHNNCLCTLQILSVAFNIPFKLMIKEVEFFETSSISNKVQYFSKISKFNRYFFSTVLKIYSSINNRILICCFFVFSQQSKTLIVICIVTYSVVKVWKHPLYLLCQFQLVFQIFDPWCFDCADLLHI